MPLLSRHRLHRLLRPAWLGTLRRLTPLSQQWGADRGTTVSIHLPFATPASQPEVGPDD